MSHLILTTTLKDNRYYYQGRKLTPREASKSEYLYGMCDPNLLQTSSFYVARNENMVTGFHHCPSHTGRTEKQRSISGSVVIVPVKEYDWPN